MSIYYLCIKKELHMRRRNKLYTANRWNVPSVFAEDTDREHQNLFGKGGGMNYLQGHVSQIANNLTSDYMNKYKNMLGLNNTTSSNINSGLIGKSLSNTSGLFSTTSGLNYSTLRYQSLPSPQVVGT